MKLQSFIPKMMRRKNLLIFTTDGEGIRGVIRVSIIHQLMTKEINDETFHTLLNKLYVVTISLNITVMVCNNVICISLLFLCCRYEHSYLTCFFCSNLDFFC